MSVASLSLPPAHSGSSAIALFTAELVWTGRRLERGIGIGVDGHGRIVAVGPLTQLGGLPVQSLGSRAVFPGFVNTHSHAFQRVIRGRTMTRPVHDRRADFWSWRTRMYEVALRLGPEELEAVTAYCYMEMLAAGITSVAEFHYLHHDLDGSPYPEPNRLGLAVLAAARAVGLRALILPVAYHRGGFGVPSVPEQRRFVSSSLEAFLEQVGALQARVNVTCQGEGPGPCMARVGIAAHSVRAVPESWLGPLSQAAADDNLPFHIHISEQEAEVRACLKTHGLRPVELLEREGGLRRGTVLVHGTHLSSSEKALAAARGAQVSVCPTTERDLGDGLVDALGLKTRGVGLSLGSDSHVQIDFFAEMRCLEGHERLRRQQRNVLLEPPVPAGHTSGQESRWFAAAGDLERSVVPSLWRAATFDGAAALGFPVGAFLPGRAFDAMTIDLSSRYCDGADAESLPGLLICAGTPDAIAEVYVSGRRVIEGGVHPEEGLIRQRYRRVCRRLWG